MNLGSHAILPFVVQGLGMGLEESYAACHGHTSYPSELLARTVRMLDETRRNAEYLHLEKLLVWSGQPRSARLI